MLFCFVFTILLFFLLAGLFTNATTFNVTVSNNQFSPANIPNVVVGDIIKFNFAASNFHNVISSPLGSVPAGAAALNSGAPGSVTTSYSYTVTRAGSYRYYCQVHSSNGTTGMVGTFTVSGIVPVTLQNFEVAYANKTITAKWQTASEQNIAYFSLQKSVDGKTYTETGHVNATGNASTLQSYSYKDESLDMTARYIYYMLKTVNTDGSYSLSAVKLARNDQAIKKLITQIGPNPVSREVGHLMFQFNADRNSSLKALVLDANGKTIMNLSMSANKGINNGHIHMGDDPVGMYTVIFSLDGLKETKKIVVVE